jgi:hypothetical protein
MKKEGVNKMKIVKIQTGNYDVFVNDIKKYEIINVKDYHPVQGKINIWNVKFENTHPVYDLFETKYSFKNAKEFINQLEENA